MNPPCAKCRKTVYPTEKLNCLDKVWHKMCFKCDECGLTLTMKNYKGYNKVPYCQAHYPTTKFTAVSDTPENRRLKSNTQLQSQLQYHSQFEQERGKYTAVSDDPETLRILQNQKNISQVVYHNEFEQSKGKVTSVVDDPTTLRVQQNQKVISQLEYHKDFEENKYKFTSIADDPETRRAAKNQAQCSQSQYHKDFEENKYKVTSIADHPDVLRAQRNQANISQVKYHEEFEKNVKGTKINVVDDPETLRAMKNQNITSQINYHDHHGRIQEQESRRQLIDSGDNVPQNVASREPGSISDYNPAPELAPPAHHQHQTPQQPQQQQQQQQDVRPSPYSARTQGQSTIYNAGTKAKVEPMGGRRVGSIADYDPVNERYGSIGNQQYVGPSGGMQGNYRGGQQHQQPQQQMHHHPQQQQQQPHQAHHHQHHQPQQQQQQQQQHHHHPQHHQQMASAQPSYHQQPYRKDQHVAPSSANSMARGPAVQLGQPLAFMMHQTGHDYNPPPVHSMPPPAAPPQAPPPAAQQQKKKWGFYRGKQRSARYVALYDYEAADNDEVSFQEGDTIIDAEPIDDGWMTGRVQRTGQHGMLPANYVEVKY